MSRLHIPLPPPETKLGEVRKALADYTHLPLNSFKLIHAGAVMKDDNASCAFRSILCITLELCFQFVPGPAHCANLLYFAAMPCAASITRGAYVGRSTSHHLVPRPSHLSTYSKSHDHRLYFSPGPKKWHVSMPHGIAVGSPVHLAQIMLHIALDCTLPTLNPN